MFGNKNILPGPLTAPRPDGTKMSLDRLRMTVHKNGQNLNPKLFVINHSVEKSAEGVEKEIVPN
jgi:hypothetical protein